MPDTPKWTDVQPIAQSSSSKWSDVQPIEGSGGADASGTKGSQGAAQAGQVANMGNELAGKIQGIKGKISDTYDKLTNPVGQGEQDIEDKYGKVVGGAAKFVGGLGASLMGAPGAIYHDITDPMRPDEAADFAAHGSKPVPGELAAERLLGARALVKGARDWLNPETRPSWEQVKSVAPEALGTGAAHWLQG